MVAIIPSDGELRIGVVDGPRYPSHHVHYYNAATNVEAGVQVTSAPITRLDKESPGYPFIHNLTYLDGIVVSLPVARYMISQSWFKADVFTAGTNESFLVRDNGGSILGVKGLEWHSL